MGTSHSCALTVDSIAWCWGHNDWGQLGDSSVARSQSTPVTVAGGLRFAAITAGSSHTCGLTGNGDVWCWGINISGQVGTAATGRCFETVSLEGFNTCHNIPVLVGGPYMRVAAGNAMTCARTTASGLECWGGTWSGGVRMTIESNRSYSFTDLGFFGCGRSTADGRVYCSSNNNSWPDPYLALTGQR